MLSTGFFDSVGENGPLYGQEEFNRYFEKIYRSGISVTDEGEVEFAVKKADASSVKIEPGFAIIKGFYAYLEKEMFLSLPIDAKAGMKYRVVLVLDYTHGNSSIDVKFKAITASSPGLERKGNIYELSLATLTLNDSGIDESSIIDDRENELLCGTIRPRWIENFQRREIFIQKDEPKERVRGAIWIDLE